MGLVGTLGVWLGQGSAAFGLLIAASPAACALAALWLMMTFLYVCWW
jgi:hypothetical protein